MTASVKTFYVHRSDQPVIFCNSATPDALSNDQYRATLLS
jgi:hypothetical protein